MISPSLQIATRGVMQSENESLAKGDALSTSGRLTISSFIPNLYRQQFTFLTRMHREIIFPLRSYHELIFQVRLGYYEPYRQYPLGDR